MGKYVGGSWTCNDCLAKSDGEEKFSTVSLNHNDSNSMHHEHIGAANKSDISPNTPTSDDAEL
jgi:hypothetical protein